jgi:hypothetical protein
LGQYGYEFHFKEDSEKVRSAVFSEPTGSQLHHVLRYLHQSHLAHQEKRHSNRLETETRECILSAEGTECLPSLASHRDPEIEAHQLLDSVFDNYQFVYQPAMSMYER